MTDSFKAVPKVNPRQIKLLLTYLLRCSQVRDEAKQQLEAEHFSRSSEAHWAGLWRIVKELSEDFPTADVPYEVLYDRVAEASEMAADTLDEPLRLAILATPADKAVSRPGLLWRAYKKTKARDLDPAAGMELLKRFLTERAALEPLVQALVETGPGIIPERWSEVVEKSIVAASRIEAIGNDPFVGIAPRPGTAIPVPKPTGIYFVDEYIGGGHAPGEAYGVLGPTGGGKTTLLVQIATSVSQQSLVEALMDPSLLQYAMCFSYEEDAIKLQSRVIANVGNIDRTRLEKALVDPRRLLSHRGNLMPYEVELCHRLKADPANYPGEYERYRRVLKTMPNIKFVDMKEDGRGFGGVAELASLIGRGIERNGWRPAVVVVDSIDIMVARYLEQVTGKVDQDRKRNEIINSARKLREMIAVQYGCPVWVTNQLKAKATKMAPTAMMHHSDATDAAGWANPLDFATVIGNLDQNSNVTMWRCTKTRRSAHQIEQKLVRLEGHHARWVDAEDDYTLDGDRIMSTKDAKLIHGLIKPRAPSTGVTMAGNELTLD